VIAISKDAVQIKIDMLGGFAVVFNGTLVTEHLKSSSKLSRLLQYLIIHRHKTVSQEELIDILYKSDFESDPGSAVRTMVSRARSALVKGGLPVAGEIILAKNNGYIWSRAFGCAVDSEEFEELCKKAESSADNEKKLGLLMQAASLYKGDFLPDSSAELWAMPLVRRYRSMYINCVYSALELLTEAGRNKEAEDICLKALRIDPFDEAILEYHLRILIALGKNTEAHDEYKRMEIMYYDVLGVNFSESLRSLYKYISHPVIKEGITLEDLLTEWVEGADSPGAYYCDLSVFKTLYQVEARSLSRSGKSAFIVRFETKHEPGTKNGDVMAKLGTAIPGCLRTGDLFTRSGPNQYMLMLHNLTYEHCKTVISRILYTLDAKYLPKVIGTSIKPVKPIV